MSDSDLRYKTLGDFSRMLRLFEEQDVDELSVSEIAKLLDASPSKMSRMLKMLESEDLFERSSARGKYRLAVRFSRLGLIQLVNQPIRSIVLPHLEEMARESGAVVSWGVGARVRGMTLISDRISLTENGHLVHLTGSIIPFFSSCYGRVFLAYMDEDERDALLSAAPLQSYTDNTITDVAALRQMIADTKQNRYALEEGEAFPGVSAMSVPLLDRTRNLAAVLNLSDDCSFAKFDKAKLLEYLVARGAFISRQLGYGGE